MPDEVLGARALNRALLQRQGLLDRRAEPVTAVLERLVGVHAQVPGNAYVALWSRLRDFDPEQLSALLASRAAVRAQTFRATLRLHTARDALAIAPVTAPVLARTWKSPYARRLHGADAPDVVRAGLALLRRRPLTRAELGAELAPRWPDADADALAQTVTFHTALVQVPPRGLWRGVGQARWAPLEDWVGEPPAPPDPDALVRRFLAAYGPASVADVRTWSGLTGLAAVVARLRPELRSFRDEEGRELLDVPDGALPDPATPAPPRFLPEYDDVLLAHARRARVHDGRGAGLPFPRGSWIGTLLVDGFYRANWSAAVEGDVATLRLDRCRLHPDDPPRTREAIEAEADGLLALLFDKAGERRMVDA